MRSNPFLRTRPVLLRGKDSNPHYEAQNLASCQLDDPGMPLLTGAGDACTAQDISGNAALAPCRVGDSLALAVATSGSDEPFLGISQGVSAVVTACIQRGLQVDALLGQMETSQRIGRLHLFLDRFEPGLHVAEIPLPATLGLVSGESFEVPAYRPALLPTLSEGCLVCVGHGPGCVSFRHSRALLPQCVRMASTSTCPS